MRSPRSLLLSVLHTPAPQPVSTAEVLQPLSIFIASPGPAPTAPTLPVLGPRPGRSTAGGGSRGQSRGGQSPPCPLPPSADAAQDAVGLPGCERTLLPHVQLFVHQNPHGLFTGVSSSPCLHTSGIAPTGPCSTSLSSRVHPAQVHMDHPAQVTQDGVPSFCCANCTTQRGILSKVLRVHSIPLSASSIKCSKTDPWGTSLVTTWT